MLLWILSCHLSISFKTEGKCLALFKSFPVEGKIFQACCYPFVYLSKLYLKWIGNVCKNLFTEFLSNFMLLIKKTSDFKCMFPCLQHFCLLLLVLVLWQLWVAFFLFIYFSRWASFSELECYMHKECKKSNVSKDYRVLSWKNLVQSKRDNGLKGF